VRVHAHLRLTGGPHPSSRSLHRCRITTESGPSPTRRPCPRRLSSRARTPRRGSGLFKAPPTPPFISPRAQTVAPAAADAIPSTAAVAPHRRCLPVVVGIFGRIARR
jgi:hypothetical protein